MAKIEVIKSNEEFQKVFEKGHSIYGRYLVVYFLHTDLNIIRVGFCVGKKLGNAVIRNRVKRLLREAAKTVFTPDMGGWDILLVAKKSTCQISLSNIIMEIKNIIDKARLDQPLKLLTKE